MVSKSISDFISQKNYPLIIIDERERGTIRKEFDQFPRTYQIETLKVADYIVSPEMGIERKRGDDLVASICDNRFFSQLYQLKKYFSKPLIILEEPRRMFNNTGVYEASIYGAIMYAIYKIDIPIVTTRTSYETAQTIWSFAKFSQKNAPFDYDPLEIEEEPITINSQINFLEGLFNTSEIKAKILLEHFGTPDKVIEAIKITEILYTKSGKAKGISGPLGDLKGFGKKYVEQNKKLILNSFSDE